VTNLHRKSIDVILENQAESGAYIASPAFPQYAYCWLRDGSFIAYSMDRVGEHESARAFFHWVHRTLQRYAWKVERVLAQPDGHWTEDDYLHTRYTLEGEEASGPWWNFQLDGYGAWLWALSEHVTLTRDWQLLEQVAPSVELTVRYLAAVWTRPNYDYWEEFGDRIHVSTLASLYGGFRGLQGLQPNPALDELMVAVRQFVLTRAVQDGHLVKYLGTDAVDASLVAASTPFGMFSPDDPIMRATVSKIERDLVHGGGTHRYALDTYYGGGEWTLLSAWLGWYHAEAGDLARARRYLAWVEAQADENDHLPEQVSTHMLFPDRFAEWKTRWGPIAGPLLWAHAMYLILYEKLYSSAQERLK